MVPGTVLATAVTGKTGPATATPVVIKPAIPPASAVPSRSARFNLRYDTIMAGSYREFRI